MKKLNIKTNLFTNKHPHFIGSWNIENDTLCREMINFFEENNDLHGEGRTGNAPDPLKKKTTDISIIPEQLKDLKFKCFNNYLSELHKCFVDYQEQWPFMKFIIKNVDIGPFNFQRYLPGDHFSNVHTERCNLESLHRVFAWMTYLNDVEDSATTNFSHYNISIKPEMGKTLIWPAEWTHAHSAGVLKKGVKYIVTGWMHFPHEE
tara:strand:- start:82 stop:696 length:615 start_codon:yes stop_codon:yes gene_type:complete